MKLSKTWSARELPIGVWRQEGWCLELDHDLNDPPNPIEYYSCEYIVINKDETEGPSSSLWIVPSTLSEGRENWRRAMRALRG